MCPSPSPASQPWREKAQSPTLILQFFSARISDYFPTLPFYSGKKFPGVFARRRIEGELLWDGGLGSSVPVVLWVEAPAITHIAAHGILHTAQVRARERSHRFQFPHGLTRRRARCAYFSASKEALEVCIATCISGVSAGCFSPSASIVSVMISEARARVTHL